MNIYDVLSKGAANAQTGRELAEQFNCNIRDISKAIEKERREGKPICANARGKYAGYYIAETPEELEAYCKQLYHRGGELFKTRRALIVALEQLRQQRVQLEHSEQQEAAQCAESL